jgi:hypothetical protein
MLRVTHHIQINRFHTESLERKLDSGENSRSEEEEVASSGNAEVC